jgi:hypothetical protein
MEPTWWSLLLGKILISVLTLGGAVYSAVLVQRARNPQPGQPHPLLLLSRASAVMMFVVGLGFGVFVDMTQLTEADPEYNLIGGSAGVFLLLSVILGCLKGWKTAELEVPLHWPLFTLKGMAAKVVSALILGLASLLLLGGVILVVDSIGKLL